MAIHAPITLAEALTPAMLVEDAHIWVGEAEAVLRLAINEIVGSGPEIVALGAVQSLLAKSMTNLDAAEAALIAAERRAA